MLTALALKLGIPQRLLVGGMILLAVLGAVIAFNLWLSGEKKEAVQADRAKANIEAVEANRKADARAADQRLEDQAANQKLQQELTDAVKDLPDAVPSARRLARACQRLRTQGTDTSALSQCRGPEAEAGTAP